MLVVCLTKMNGDDRHIINTGEDVGDIAVTIVWTHLLLSQTGHEIVECTLRHQRCATNAAHGRSRWDASDSY